MVTVEVQMDPLDDIDDFRAVPAATMAEMKELLAENWAKVARIAKRIERYGPLTAHLLQGGVTHELCLIHRDALTLAKLLGECSDGEIVNMQRLRDVCSAAVAPYQPSPRRPPFAVKGDQAAKGVGVQGDLETRKKNFQAAVHRAANGSATLSRRQFNSAINAIDRYGVSDREATDLYSVLDPKKSGHVNVSDFCERFTFEFLKPKSMRETLGSQGVDGKHDAFQWPTINTKPRHHGHAAPSSARSRGSSSHASPRGSGPRTTRSSALRAQTNTALRQATTTESYFTELNSAQRKRGEPPQLLVPKPPPTRGRRINLSIIADPTLLGNVPQA